MKDIVITTDSGICPIKKEDTKIIPAIISCSNGFSYSDDGSIENKKILENIEKGFSYKTASPILGNFDETFRNVLKEKKDIIHLSMSSGISEGSVNGATLVANYLNEEYDNKIYVIDSLTGATGGTLFYELAYQELLNSNLPTNELVNKLNILKNKIQTSFYVPNIDGYIKSGRDKTNSNLKKRVLSTTSQIIKKFNFKFRVDFNKKGDLYLKEMFRGSQSLGMDKIVKDIVNDNTIENYDKRLVVLGNLFKDKVDMEKIKDYLKSFNYFDNIIEKEIGSVVAAYGCKDLCGIALVKKKV